MTKIARSPERHTFQAESSRKKLLENPNDENALAMIKMYDDWREADTAKESDVEWQKNNMEYDMRTSEWMCAKVKANNVYAQNLYAAMCNRTFQKLDVVPILKSQTWSASWRSAGGIVANMQEKGDYMDWYCSGIKGADDEIDYAAALAAGYDLKEYVSESVVTEEIENDLKKLGWIVLPADLDNY